MTPMMTHGFIVSLIDEVLIVFVTSSNIKNPKNPTQAASIPQSKVMKKHGKRLFGRNQDRTVPSDSLSQGFSTRPVTCCFTKISLEPSKNEIYWVHAPNKPGSSSDAVVVYDRTIYRPVSKQFITSALLSKKLPETIDKDSLILRTTPSYPTQAIELKLVGHRLVRKKYSKIEARLPQRERIAGAIISLVGLTIIGSGITLIALASSGLAILGIMAIILGALFVAGGVSNVYPQDR